MGFKYMYVEAKVGSMFTNPNHRELIDKYANEGWRFVTAIPLGFNRNNGQIKSFDLVFEKSEE